MIRWFPILAAACLAAPLAAQNVTPALDSALERAGARGPAVALAVIYRGQTVYARATGLADPEHRVPATLETRFDWASVAKQITAFAIAQLVEQGRAAPGDPVQRFLPELAGLGVTVTLDQLIHHTSGIEDVDGLLVLSGVRPGDPVSAQDALAVLLRQRHVRSMPGEQQAYGNGSYVLLAEVVSRLNGRSFAAALDSSVFRPLGMRNSGFVEQPDDAVPNRAVPVTRDRTRGGWRLAATDVYPGAGGLFATVGDMARWGWHVLHPAMDPAATMRLRERGRLASGEAFDYAWGLGWGSFRGRRTLSHAGSGPASDAMLVLFPDDDLVIVAAASGDTDPTAAALAYRAAELLLADRLAEPVAPTGRRMMLLTMDALTTRPPESEGVVRTPEELAPLAGTYRFPEPPALVVRANGDRLEYAMDGREPWIPLFPLPDGRYVTVPWWDTFTFERNASGRVVRMVRERTPRSLRSNAPARVPGERLPDRRFDVTTAAPYVGWYTSDELGSWFEVALSGDSLLLRHPRLGAMPLLPLGDDTFGIAARGLVRATFARARPGGPAVGLELEATSWSTRSGFRRAAEPQRAGSRRVS